MPKSNQKLYSRPRVIPLGDLAVSQGACSTGTGANPVDPNCTTGSNPTIYGCANGFSAHTGCASGASARKPCSTGDGVGPQ